MYRFAAFCVFCFLPVVASAQSIAEITPVPTASATPSATPTPTVVVVSTAKPSATVVATELAKAGPVESGLYVGIAGLCLVVLAGWQVSRFR